MVCATGQLEGEHGGNDGGHVWDYVGGVEHQCGEGIQAADAGEGEILPESIVRTSLSLRNGMSFRLLTVEVGISWSKQIIEHERAEAAKEAAVAAAAKEQQQ